MRSYFLELCIQLRWACNARNADSIQHGSRLYTKARSKTGDTFGIPSHTHCHVHAKR